MEGGGTDNSSPYFFSDTIYAALDNALDYGISEHDFWNMTLAELDRLFRSKRRIEKQKLQEKAFFDYQLANMIGICVMHDEKTKIPEIEEVYPTLFDAKKIQEERKLRKQQEAAMRFKQFASSFNQKIRKEDAMNE